MAKPDIAAIRGVLFDKDGTLIDFRATWLPAYRAAADLVSGHDAELARRLLAAGGFEAASGRLDPRSALAVGTNREIADLWRDVAGLDTDPLGALETAFEQAAETTLTAVTDLPVLFRTLREAGLVLGIATNDDLALAEAAVETFGLEGLVDFVTGADAGHGGKPGPGMAQAFCAATGLAPPAVMMVGDSAADAGMARSAGLGLFVGVASGVTPAEELARYSDLVFDSIEALPGLLTASAPPAPR